MKIGIVLHETPGYSETFLRNKILFLKENGFDVKLYVDGGQNNFHLCSVNKGFSVTDNRIRNSIFLLHALKRLLINPINSAKLFVANKKDGFSLKRNILSLIKSAHILSSNLDWLHFGFATVAVNRENLARIIGAKMAVSIRGFDVCIFPLSHPNVYNLLWKRLDKLHFISDDLLKVARELGFNEVTKSHKITPAIDVNLFKKEEFHSIIKVESRVSIVTVARLHWKKGIDFTLAALKIIKEEGILFEYQVIGEGLEYERLVFERHQLGLDDYVVFRGKLSPDKIKEKLAAADLYIQYSIQEGFCNAVLEAQSMGCLCLVSNAEGLNENVLDGTTGFVIEKRNPRLLADYIKKALSLSSQDKELISSQAIERVTNQFNLEKQKQEFLNFYKDLN
jgi:colanic acid/amylovoran biosynthesis glycosyltransferase